MAHMDDNRQVEVYRDIELSDECGCLNLERRIVPVEIQTCLANTHSARLSCNGGEASGNILTPLIGAGGMYSYCMEHTFVLACLLDGFIPACGIVSDQDPPRYIRLATVSQHLIKIARELVIIQMAVCIDHRRQDRI